MAAYTSGTRYRKDCTNYFISMGCLWEAMIVQCWHCNKYCEVVSTLEVRHKHTLFLLPWQFLEVHKITWWCTLPFQEVYIVKWLMLLKSDITHIMLVTMLLLSGQHLQIESTCVCS